MRRAFGSAVSFLGGYVDFLDLVWVGVFGGIFGGYILAWVLDRREKRQYEKYIERKNSELVQLEFEFPKK